MKILDFGLAKAVSKVATDSETTWTIGEPRTTPGAVLGTAGYMSPEQLKGNPVDARSDVWAFGCCLFECLAGCSAFRGETAPERMVATLEREPDWDSLGDVPRPVRELIGRCLEKDPSDRLPAMSEAAATLRRVDGG